MDHADAGALEALFQAAGEALVQLDSEDPGAGRGKGSGDRAAARAEVEDEVARAEPGVADQLNGDRAVPQEVRSAVFAVFAVLA